MKTEVFISYKIGESRSEKLRDELRTVLQEESFGLSLITDIDHLKVMGDVQKFMKRLGEARFVIIILSPEFLRSQNCMFELATMSSKGRLKERVFPVVFEGTMISTPEERFDHSLYWKSKYETLKEKVGKLSPSEVHETTKAELKKLQTIVKESQNALSSISETRHLTGGAAVGEVAENIRGWILKEMEREGRKLPALPWKKILIIGMLVTVTSFIFLWIQNRNGEMAGDRKKALADFLRRDTLLKTPDLQFGNSALRTDTVFKKETDTIFMTNTLPINKITGGNGIILGNPSGDTKLTSATPTLDPAIQKLKNDMKRIPGGTFTMGSNDQEDEKPHSVTVSTFSIGIFEVTQKEWKAVMGWPNPSNFKCDDCPVEMVSWNEVQEFIKELNEITKETYRLPTEAEWEFAAGGGNKSQGYECSGGNVLNEVGWYNANSDSKTHPVGEKKIPNELGLYDMSGNVWEWCQDWYAAYPGGKIDVEANKNRVVRGGSWNAAGDDCRVSNRDFVIPNGLDNFVGFRLARTDP